MPNKILRGVNVDPMNGLPGTAPSPSWLAKNNFNAVRLVGRPSEGPQSEDYAKACKKAGIFVMDAVTAASKGQLLANADLYQLRNEVDIASPSSEGVIPPDEYAAEVLIYLGTYPDLKFTLGSLAAGEFAASYLSSTLEVLVASGQALDNLVGYSIHPYAKTLAPARDLVLQHSKVARQILGRVLPAYVSEWNRPAYEIPGFDWWLRTGLDGGAAFWFSADDNMVNGFGLTRNGKPKQALREFKPFNATPVAVPPTKTYQPDLVTSDWMSIWDNGNYPAPPVGFLLHGSRSGVDSLTTLEEFWGTAHFTKTRQDELAYTATVGTDMLSWGLPISHWGWHARAVSPHRIGVEFAQPLESHPIDDGQVRAFCWLVRQARAVWPSIPLDFPTHAEVDGTVAYGGYRDGKTDPFTKGVVGTTELRARIKAELAKQGITS